MYTVERHVTAAEAERVWKEGLFGNFVLSTQFWYQLRTALKNKVYSIKTLRRKEISVWQL